MWVSSGHRISHVGLNVFPFYFQKGPGWHDDRTTGGNASSGSRNTEIQRTEKGDIPERRLLFQAASFFPIIETLEERKSRPSFHHPPHETRVPKRFPIKTIRPHPDSHTRTHYVPIMNHSVTDPIVKAIRQNPDTPKHRFRRIAVERTTPAGLKPTFVTSLPLPAMLGY